MTKELDITSEEFRVYTYADGSTGYSRPVVDDELVASLLAWQGDMPDALKADLGRAATRLSEMVTRIGVLEEAAQAALDLISGSRAEGKGPTNAECLLRQALTGKGDAR